MKKEQLYWPVKLQQIWEIGPLNTKYLIALTFFMELYYYFVKQNNFVPCDSNKTNVEGKTMIEHCVLQLSGRRIYS